MIFDIDGFCFSERESVRQIDPRVALRNITRREKITKQIQDNTLEPNQIFEQKYKSGYFEGTTSISSLLYFTSQFIPVQEWCEQKLNQSSSCAMIYLFTRDPNSYDKLRDPSKKIYFEYHDAWDTTSVDAWIFILGNIILALAYFANF